MSLFIWTFQCFTLVLAWRNFLWAACGAGGGKGSERPSAVAGQVQTP